MKRAKRLIPIKHLSRSYGSTNGGVAFGGDLLKKSHAKTARPFSPRAAIHVVMRARKPFALLKRGRRERIEKLVADFAKRNQIRVHRFANAGNHLHFLIECREKRSFNSFVRSVSGTIARFVKLDERKSELRNWYDDSKSDHDKKEAAIKQECLWMQRPWTRLLKSSGRSFVNAWRYVDLNEIEGDCWGITRKEARFLQAQDIGLRGIDPPR